MFSQIEKMAAALAPQLSVWRRHLHRIPETGWNERETSAFLASELEKMGYEICSGKDVTGHETGLIATLRCEGSAGGDHPDHSASGGQRADGPVFALRFDIDALPVEEADGPEHLPALEGFRSRHPGCMHACGHDGHAAAGLGCARLLRELQPYLSCTVRLIFQPAEEGARGASPIVERGWLSDVSWFLAGHITGREYGGPEEPDVVPVCSSLATTKFDVVFHGRSCHGAQPEKGASAISAMAASVLALNTIPRHSGGATFLNVGRVSAGEGRNIVAGNAFLEAEVRGATTELNQYMEDRSFEIIRHCAAMYGCTADISIRGHAPSLESSPDFCRRLTAMCRDRLSGIRAAEHPEIFRASEDAAVMLNAVREAGGQGAFLLFPSHTAAPLHSSRYDFEESVLPKAVSVFVSAVFCCCGTDGGRL